MNFNRRQVGSHKLHSIIPEVQILIAVESSFDLLVDVKLHKEIHKELKSSQLLQKLLVVTFTRFGGV